MARQPGRFSSVRIWVALFLSLSAGIAVSTWQSEVQTRRDRNWALKTIVVEESSAEEDSDKSVNQVNAFAENKIVLPVEASPAPTTVDEPLVSSKPAPAELIEPTVEVPVERVAEKALEPIAPVLQPLLPPIAGVGPALKEAAVPESHPASPLQEATSNDAAKASVAKLESKPDDQKSQPKSIDEVPLPLPKSPATDSCIAEPKALLADLELLKQVDAFSNFALRVQNELKTLQSLSSQDSHGLATSFERLEAMRLQGLDLAQSQSSDAALAIELRVVHGLSRRLEIWKSLVGRGPLMVSTGLAAEPIRTTAARLREELSNSQNPAASDWNRFLLLNELQAAQQGDMLNAEEYDLMKRISLRAHSTTLSEAQRSFLKTGQQRDLLTVIDMYLLDAPSSQELLAEIETYELEPNQDSATRIALALGRLSLSPAANDIQLVKKLSQFYRAANVRVAISESLINELIPSPEDSQEAVNDHLMGASVTGRSNVSTRLRVQLVPDQTRWRVGLEATGNVASNTQAFRGPFTFFNQGWANYRARTTVGLGREGFQMNTPTAEASSQTDLLDLQSDFDGIPLVGLLARSVARQKLAQSELEAQWEVEGRMARRIEQKLDTELQSRIRQAEKEWSSRVAGPLEDLRLGPTPVAMETTAQRLIARYRIAGAMQLASNTARPLAPSDSVLSVQLHASAINNFLEQLGLDGKTYKLEDMFLHLTKAMGQPNAEIPEDMPANIHVRFADKDSLRLDIVNGEAILTVRMAEIRQGKSKWKNVQVRGHFAPKVDGLNAELQRTSYVELKGDGLKKIGGGQVVLRIAFTSVLSRVSNLPLMHPKLSTHPKMANYEIRQFVLEDGWIGLAIGPKLTSAASKPVPERAETARRPKTPVIDSILRR